MIGMRKIAMLLGIGARPAGAEPGARGVSRADHHHGRLLWRRRRHRHRSAADRHAAGGSARPAGGGGKPRRRRRQSRHQRGAARDAGRLYAARLLQRLRGQSEPVRQRQLRRDQGFRAGDAARRLAQRLHGQERLQDQDAAGIHRHGESQCRQDELDQPRRRHHALSRRRNPQDALRASTCSTSPIARCRPRCRRCWPATSK